MDNRQQSYTASNIVPWKIAQGDGIVANGFIRPVHVQFYPTNLCNLSCSWCSCAGRDDSLSLPKKDIEPLIRMFVFLGMKSATITGGGDPLMYPYIDDLLWSLSNYKVAIGMVTNGTLLHVKLRPELTKRIEWIRISAGDGREFSSNYFEHLDHIISRTSHIDYAFSYVVTNEPDYEQIGRILEFAEEQSFTHVRLVTDLMDITNAEDMKTVKEQLHGMPGEQLVIYQDRKQYTAGFKRCLISLLKPLVGPDGMIYPCCGVQYALPEPRKDLEPSMSMGHWREFAERSIRQNAFDGSNCVVCYYEHYQTLLEQMSMHLEHGDFV